MSNSNIDNDKIKNNDREVSIAMKNLLSYQVPHVYQLFESFQNQQCILDASDTGTGKTYVTLALSALMGLKPFIICPKSVIYNWIDVSKKLGIKLIGISNYEKLKGCKYFDDEMNSLQCPYADKDEIDKKNIKFKFKFPDDCIVIFDEAHRCKNHKTANSKILFGVKESGVKTLLLSATITDKIDCFRPFGVIFGLYESPKKFTLWFRRQIDSKKVELDDFLPPEGMDFKTAVMLKVIHDTIFPSRGSRMKIKELGDLFPQNQILAKCYYSDNHDEVNALYAEINSALDDLRNKEKQSSCLGKIMRARMKIEMLKVPIMLDLIEDALEEGFSVAVFVNFKDTMNYLAHHMKVDCFIHGDQTAEERQYCIDDFQSNKCKVLISIIQAGGVGISLHDIHGGHPRMSIISPSWSGTDTVQVLGRIHRAGAKSPAQQRLVYIAKSYEEVICKTISSKLTVLSAINDGDLAGPKIDTEKVKIVEKQGHFDNHSFVNRKENEDTSKKDEKDEDDIDNNCNIKKKKIKLTLGKKKKNNTDNNTTVDINDNMSVNTNDTYTDDTNENLNNFDNHNTKNKSKSKDREKSKQDIHAKKSKASSFISKLENKCKTNTKTSIDKNINLKKNIVIEDENIVNKSEYEIDILSNKFPKRKKNQYELIKDNEPTDFELGKKKKIYYTDGSDKKTNLPDKYKSK